MYQQQQQQQHSKQTDSANRPAQNAKGFFLKNSQPKRSEMCTLLHNMQIRVATSMSNGIPHAYLHPINASGGFSILLAALFLVLVSIVNDVQGSHSATTSLWRHVSRK